MDLLKRLQSAATSATTSSADNNNNNYHQTITPSSSSTPRRIISNNNHNNNHISSSDDDDDDGPLDFQKLHQKLRATKERAIQAELKVDELNAQMFQIKHDFALYKGKMEAREKEHNALRESDRQAVNIAILGGKTNNNKNINSTSDDHNTVHGGLLSPSAAMRQIQKLEVQVQELKKSLQRVHQEKASLQIFEKDVLHLNYKESSRLEKEEEEKEEQERSSRTPTPKNKEYNTARGGNDTPIDLTNNSNSNAQEDGGRSTSSPFSKAINTKSLIIKQLQDENKSLNNEIDSLLRKLEDETNAKNQIVLKKDEELKRLIKKSGEARYIHDLENELETYREKFNELTLMNQSGRTADDMLMSINDDRYSSSSTTNAPPHDTSKKEISSKNKNKNNNKKKSGGGFFDMDNEDEDDLFSDEDEDDDDEPVKNDSVNNKNSQHQQLDDRRKNKTEPEDGEEDDSHLFSNSPERNINSITTQSSPETDNNNSSDDSHQQQKQGKASINHDSSSNNNNITTHENNSNNNNIIAELQLTISEQEAAMKVLLQDARNSESQLASLNATLFNTKLQLENAERELSKTRSQKLDLDERMSVMSQEMETLQRKCDRYQRETSEKSEQLRKAKAAEQIALLKNAVDESSSTSSNNNNTSKTLLESATTTSNYSSTTPANSNIVSIAEILHSIWYKRKIPMSRTTSMVALVAVVTFLMIVISYWSTRDVFLHDLDHHSQQHHKGQESLMSLRCEHFYKEHTEDLIKKFGHLMKKV